MSLIMDFPCRRAGSGMVGDSSWVREFSKSAGASNSRGIRRAKSRRLSTQIINSSVLRVADTYQHHLPQDWTAIICLVTITVLTGLTLVLNPLQDSDFNTATSSISALFPNLKDVFDGPTQDKSRWCVVFAITTAVISHYHSRPVFVWHCDKQGQVDKQDRILSIVEASVVKAMDPKQSTLPKRWVQPPRTPVVDLRTGSSPIHTQAYASIDAEAAPRSDKISARRNRPRAYRNLPRFEEENVDPSGTTAVSARPDLLEPVSTTLHETLESLEVSESTPPVQDAPVDEQGKNLTKPKLGARLLRKAKSFMTLTPSRAGAMPLNRSIKGLTIGQPTNFQNVRNPDLEAKFAEEGAMSNQSPMRLVPLPAVARQGRGDSNFLAGDMNNRSGRNDRVFGSDALPNQSSRQNNWSPTARELPRERNDDSGQIGQSNKSSGVNQRSELSSSRSLTTGEEPLRSPKFPTKLSSPDSRKTQESGFLASLFKKEPSVAALKEYSKREYASKGVNPKDPDAAAKMKVSTRKLPPEAPKPASKEPKKKKGGGEEDAIDSSLLIIPSGLKRFSSLNNLSFRRKEDQLSTFSDQTEKISSPSFRTSLWSRGSKTSDSATSNSAGSIVEESVSLQARPTTKGSQVSNTDRSEFMMGQQDCAADQSDLTLKSEDFVLNTTNADGLASSSGRSESEEAVKSPTGKTEGGRSLAQIRRERKREALGMGGKR